jgi:CBS domain-containing protein
MDIERFISAKTPFHQLTAEERRDLAGRFVAEDVAQDSTQFAIGGEDGAFYLISEGAVELLGRDGQVLNHIGAGDMFGYRALLYGESSISQARATKPTRVLRLDGASFTDLCVRHRPLRRFFDAKRIRVRREAAGRSDSSSVSLMATPLSDMLARKPITVPPETPIRQAAQIMAEQNISSMLVTEDERLVGIVTDRDLRGKVVAAGRSTDGPLSEIMTPEPVTLDGATYGFEAMLAMAKLHIHHLPVMEDGRLAGMITSTDLLERRSSSAVFVIGDIYKRNSAAELAEVSKQIPKVLTRLQGASASAHSIGHVISSIGEAITCRLLELAEEKLGPPPVPYAFVVEGSMARHEQTALSDQDNGLLLSDEFRPEEHDEYFLAMAKFVCDGLDACGYEYCRGEIMATTPKWRQPLSVWKSYFDRWIDQPEPMALMHSSIFFDMRAIYGDVSLFDELNSHVLTKSAGNKIFLSYMASNAMALRPPLGLFGSFVLIRGGEHHKTLDLKHNGVVPIIDLARIYALSGGVPAVNTRARLEAAAGGEVSRDGAADLREALEFISTVRIAHQANAVRLGEPPDNFVPPGQLSAFERSHLKDAFALVRSMQATLEQRYQTGRLR